jgi:monoamine oxidase
MSAEWVDEADVAVVGAGLAGLVAARDVLASGRSVVVLEARARVGGRVLNHGIGDGKVVEVGGQWAGPTQHAVLALARDLGVPTFATHADGENLVELDGQIRRYRGNIPRINPAVLADIGQAQFRLDMMARSVPPEAPWRAPRAEEWDGQTMWSWIKRNTLTRAARALFQLGVEAVWAAHPADVSLLHVLFYTRAAGGFDDLIGTEGGAQQDRFFGGSQELALRLAERIGERVFLEAPVRRIEQRDDDVRVRSDRGAVRARAAIVAIPPTLCARISYDPPLPALRDQLTQRMAQGSVIKCMAIFDEPFWRQDGLSGQVTSVDGPVKVMFDNSPPDGSPGVLLGFLEGRQARELAQWTPEARRMAVVACFARLFGSRAARPSGYVEQVWAAEEWTRGCYGCLMPPGGWVSFGSALRAPIGRIRWAGAETATTWNGYMDGAVRSGESAAAAVLAALAE